MTAAEVLLITVNLMIIIGVAYVFLYSGHDDKEADKNLDRFFQQH